MTYLEIDKALYDIVNEKYNECQGRLDAVSKENKNERKALMIEREMYGLCNRAGILVYVLGKRENVLTMRRRVIGQILQRYPKLNEVFTKLDEEEKMRFLAALQAEIYMRDQIVNSYYTEFEAAKASGDMKNILELQIKIGGCENVFEAWEAWRKENNIYPNLIDRMGG
ncbi:MAG: hypothetical protein IJW50_08295 [Clostridia bacterium]|nr:hypothetical protein [Clostridia bacterium]